MASDSDAETHVMDPSDPRAHGRERLDASRLDSETEEEEIDEDLGVPVRMESDDDGDDDDNDAPREPTDDVTEKLKTRLSSWAAARFLVPRSERPVPVIEEPPLEPLNDFILSDFGSRFRGSTGNVAVEKTIDEDGEDEEDEGNESSKFQVGAPLYDTTDEKKKSKDEKKEDKPKDARKRRPESRYFVTDLATKCFNCGQVGHVSAVCANDRVQKPCYYCALRGHSTFACPHLPCSACLQLGHEARDCSNRRVAKTRSCAVCGRAGHDKHRCEFAKVPSNVTCMVCLGEGHLHCTPIPPPADRRVYCAQCAGNHSLTHCREYEAPAPTSFSARLPRSDMKCFLCNTAGHLVAECPRRTGYHGGNSCFNCGERGHYASDCPKRNVAGGGARKRPRQERFDDDDGYDRRKRRHVESDEASSDEDQYYYVPGSSSSGSGSRPRLDAALPSYRGSSSARNDRRRWR